MKKWMIITLSTCAFLFLTVRLIVKRVERGSNEKQWYIEQLNFEFSGEIDTVIRHGKYHGLVLFHITRGRVDRSLEDKLNEQLNHNGHLRFLVFQPKDQIEIISHIAYKYLPGDSVCVDTQKDKLAIYRKGKIVSENEIMASLRVKPF